MQNTQFARTGWKPVLRGLAVAGAAIFGFSSPVRADEGAFFAIQVVDAETRRGVPLVELKTVNQIRYVTDSSGYIAFREPGLMNRDVFFHVSSHGYEYAKDGFGVQGKKLHTKPGGAAVLEIKRLNVAERLYRVTGAGIYRDAVLLGKNPPTARPLLNGDVLGSDSVMNAVHRGRIYWFWGDTNRPGYPLGNFHTPGATSKLPADGGLDPAIGVDLEYFTGEDGFAKPTAKMPGAGPTWIDGLVPLKTTNGPDRLFAHYVKIKPPLEVYQHGLIEFDDETNEFRKVTEFPANRPVYPGGHPFVRRDVTHADREFVYFANPFPLVRAAANPQKIADVEACESFTCLKSGTTLDDPVVERRDDGSPVYAWKRNAPAAGPQVQQTLIKRGLLKPDEALLQLRDHATGKAVTAHRGSVYWNDFRKRWVMIAVEHFGTSVLGEVWYAEADGPLGPWVYAVKIVSHNEYSFYNPKQHPFFDADGGRTIYFEGTYTNSFSGNPVQTPRYDYNQIMYRLSLDDPRVNLPVAIYERAGKSPPQPLENRTREGRGANEPIAFFAPDRPGPGLVPIAASTAEADQLVVNGDGRALFYALPADAKSPPSASAPLYEFHNRGTGRWWYSTSVNINRPGFERADKPLCRVWSSPYKANHALFRSNE